MKSKQGKQMKKGMFGGGNGERESARERMRKDWA